MHKARRVNNTVFERTDNEDELLVHYNGDQALTTLGTLAMVLSIAIHNEVQKGVPFNNNDGYVLLEELEVPLLDVKGYIAEEIREEVFKSINQLSQSQVVLRLGAYYLFTWAEKGGEE